MRAPLAPAITLTSSAARGAIRGSALDGVGDRFVLTPIFLMHFATPSSETTTARNLRIQRDDAQQVLPRLVDVSSVVSLCSTPDCTAGTLIVFGGIRPRRRATSSVAAVDPWMRSRTQPPRMDRVRPQPVHRAHASSLPISLSGHRLTSPTRQSCNVLDRLPCIAAAASKAADLSSESAPRSGSRASSSVPRHAPGTTSGSPLGLRIARRWSRIYTFGIGSAGVMRRRGRMDRRADWASSTPKAGGARIPSRLHVATAMSGDVGHHGDSSAVPAWLLLR
jgi:hypothetical protein